MYVTVMGKSVGSSWNDQISSCDCNCSIRVYDDINFDGDSKYFSCSEAPGG
jgi:hypothetical protein